MIRFALAVTLGFASLVYGQAGTAICWGNNSYGQCNVPDSETFIEVSAGLWHSIGVRPNGTVVTWGQDGGDPPEDLSGVVKAVGGYEFTAALKNTGEVVVWGDINNWDCDHCIPQPEGELFIDIAAGWRHMVGLRPNGSVVCWGYNANYDVPDPHNAVPPGIVGATSVFASNKISGAVMPDGSIQVWGQHENHITSLSDYNISLMNLCQSDGPVSGVAVDTSGLVRHSGYFCEPSGNGQPWCDDLGWQGEFTNVACSWRWKGVAPTDDGWRSCQTVIGLRNNGTLEAYSYGYNIDFEQTNDPGGFVANMPGTENGNFFVDVAMGEVHAIALTYAPCTDTDGDGTCDSVDGCPLDPGKTTEGICGCGVPDLDSDQDGAYDCNDECPNDPTKITADSCGCGIPETNVPGDVDCDGDADADDVAALNALVGSCTADLTNDGEVGFADLLELISAWGPCSG